MKNIDNLVKLPKEAKSWIDSFAKDRIKRTSIEGVLKFFNNEFGLNLGLRQFKIIVGLK